MPTSERTPREGEIPSQKTCWALLESITESPLIKRSARLQNLLFYVGRRSLREGAYEIHEQEIGIEVYGRPAGYDTNVDNIVRVNASELRKRITAYFETEGLYEPLIMEIPRGQYIPVFRYRTVEPPKDSPADTAGPKAEPVRESEVSLTTDVPAEPVHSQKLSFSVVLPAVAILLLAISCTLLWLNNRGLNHTIHPWLYEPSIAGVWGTFLNDGRDTDIVMEDSTFLLIQNIANKTYSFNEYLSHSYLDSQQTPELSPEIRNIQGEIAGKTLARASEVRLVQKILGLDPSNQNLHIYNAREYTPALLTRDNVVLLGNPTSNPWFDLFQDSMNFREQPESEHESVIVNRAPAAHEQTAYTPSNGIAYCIVAYLTKPDHNGNILLIEGTSSEATEACGDFILSEDQLGALAKLQKTTKLPYFELLLKVSHVTGTPITATIEAYRPHP